MTNRVLLFVVATFALAKEECPEGCKEPILLYEDLKCKPVFASPTDCCPKEYDCSNLKGRTPGQCRLQGKFYKIGEKVEDGTAGNCNVGCHCSDNRGSSAAFTCAALDCAEWLGGGSFLKLTCQRKYDLNKCCSVGEICEPFNTLPKCEVGGKTYYEGQRFDPVSAKCTSCVCQKGFKGKFVEPFCKKDTCFAELRSTKQIESDCAPFYSSLNGCCPSFWICPSPKDKPVLPAAAKKDSNLKCKYGSKTLNIGDKFETEEDITKWATVCECRVPPFVTCLKK